MIFLFAHSPSNSCKIWIKWNQIHWCNRKNNNMCQLEIWTLPWELLAGFPYTLLMFCSKSPDYGGPGGSPYRTILGHHMGWIYTQTTWIISSDSKPKKIGVPLIIVKLLWKKYLSLIQVNQYCYGLTMVCCKWTC